MSSLCDDYFFKYKFPRVGISRRDQLYILKIFTNFLKNLTKTLILEKFKASNVLSIVLIFSAIDVLIKEFFKKSISEHFPLTCSVVHGVL